MASFVGLLILYQERTYTAAVSVVRTHVFSREGIFVLVFIENPFIHFPNPITMKGEEKRKRGSQQRKSLYKKRSTIQVEVSKSRREISGTICHWFCEWVRPDEAMWTLGWHSWQSLMHCQAPVPRMAGTKHAMTICNFLRTKLFQNYESGYRS